MARDPQKTLPAHETDPAGAASPPCPLKAWLERRPLFHIHFIPTSSFWMRLVGDFFADITQECVQARSFRSVLQLTRAITVHMAARNEQPRPSRWEADGAEMLVKIQRARRPSQAALRTKRL